MSLYVFDGKQLKDSDLTPYNLDESNRSIVYYGLIQDAKKNGLENDAAVQKEINKILIDAYWKKNAAAEDLKTLYEKRPQLRYYVIEISKGQNAAKKINAVLKSIERKEPFQHLAHDSDYLGYHQSPPVLYETLRLSKKNEIVGPLLENDKYYFAKLVDRKPFISATPSYLDYLKESQVREKKETLLEQKRVEYLKSGRLVIEPKETK